MRYGALTTDLGTSAFTYKRNHNNFINDESYNKNSGIRDELSPYLKANLNLGPTKFYGDIQYRMIDFIYDDPTKYLYRNWNFINWSVGATYFTDNNINFYVGIGETHREPTRTDMFGGNDEWIEESFTDITPESVVDYEIGGKYYSDNLNLNLNVYAMEFENEIVLNGQVGPNAIVIHSNVARSFRRGIELDLKYKIGKFELINASNLSMNKIIQDSTTITQVLTPSFISSSDIVYQLKNQNFGAALRYNGKSFIDFANEIEIPGYYVLDLYSNINFHQLNLGVKLNNILNKLYYTNGVIGFDGNPGYFQHAGFNILLTLKYTL
jgi:iron complex outermembrane receptor protein